MDIEDTCEHLNMRNSHGVIEKSSEGHNRAQTDGRAEITTPIRSSTIAVAEAAVKVFL
jgi:hypothetical protein